MIETPEEEEVDSLSYHDVVVYCGNVRYKPSDNYALTLGCVKVSGWRLWYKWRDKEKLLGGEFDGEPFCIEIAGTVVLGKKPAEIIDPKPFGWDGWVNNG